MSINKAKTVDQITILEKGIIQYRETTRIIEDGVQLAEAYHRKILTPISDMSDVPADVIVVCNTVWTPEIIKAYKDSQNDNINT